MAKRRRTSSRKPASSGSNKARGTIPSSTQIGRVLAPTASAGQVTRPATTGGPIAQQP